jgi:predicted transcriptional regulator
VNPFETLRHLTGKKAPGRTSDFTEAYVFKALRIIQEHKLGRKQLSERLGLGEGTIRTLVKRLLDEGLIETSRQGMSLKEEGKIVVKDINKVLVGIEFPKTSITVANKNFAVLVRNVSRNIRYGVEQRDEALLAGAKGASTLIMEAGEFIMPSVETGIDNESLEFLKVLKPEEGDVVVIGSADSLLLAEIGAYSAALRLLS